MGNFVAIVTSACWKSVHSE